MVYADLDGLKGINDSFGHKEGDRALVKAAELLKETFRSSDVLGRLGGDEFTILAAVNPDDGREKMLARLREKFDNYNALRVSPYDLSISVGVAQLDPETSESMEDLLAAADAAMYENKRGKTNKSWPQPPTEAAAAVA